MGEVFEPEDKHLERGGEAGAEAVDAALKRFNLSLNQIITSRTPNIDLVRHELQRERMPAGFLSWQLPAYLRGGVTHFFIQSAQAGAILPSHSHKAPQLRIILSGGVLFNGVELKSGDWIFTPPDASYSLSASMNPGATIAYAY